MKKNILTFLFAVIVLFLAGKLATLPWWVFTIPLFIVGIITALLKWEIKAFATGFLAGFTVWLGMNIYFDLNNGGIILQKMAVLMAVQKIIVLLAAGITGGLLTGLALYAGREAVLIKK